MYSYGKWISQNKNTALLVVLPFFKHEYTVWAICGDRGFERYCPITKKNWTRICTRCREQETVDVEPIEVTRLHKLQEINDMEEKLKQMKSE